MEKQGKSKFALWLDTLQQESWQLELVISGFAIFLLLGLYDPMQSLLREGIALASSSKNMAGLLLPVIILQGAWLVLLINLVIHILLRGLWISTVGLRYVSEDIDFETLRFHVRFDRFLKKNIVSFDRYIEQLEKVCSIIFAFSFLLVFILIALGLWMALLGSVDYFLNIFSFGEKLHNVLDSVITITIVLTGLLYFIDFITLGWVKRSRWLARIYYPIYRFYGWVTLSFMYRPLYYNLIDNQFGRRVALLLVPYIILIMVLSSLTIVTDTYIPIDAKKRGLETKYYDDIRGKTDLFGRVSIPSKYVSNNFLELFLLYSPRPDDEAIEALCPGLTPARKTGLSTGGIIKINGSSMSGSGVVDVDSLLECISQIHRVYIDDSLYTDLRYRFYLHPGIEKNGLLTILDIQSLDRGEHLLKIENYVNRDSLKWREAARLPFWKE